MCVDLCTVQGLSLPCLLAIVETVIVHSAVTSGLTWRLDSVCPLLSIAGQLASLSPSPPLFKVKSHFNSLARCRHCHVDRRDLPWFAAINLTGNTVVSNPSVQGPQLCSPPKDDCRASTVTSDMYYCFLPTHEIHPHPQKKLPTSRIVARLGLLRPSRHDTVCEAVLCRGRGGFCCLLRSSNRNCYS